MISNYPKTDRLIPEDHICNYSKTFNIKELTKELAALKKGDNFTIEFKEDKKAVIDNKLFKNVINILQFKNNDNIEIKAIFKDYDIHTCRPLKITNNNGVAIILPYRVET